MGLLSWLRRGKQTSSADVTAAPVQINRYLSYQCSAIQGVGRRDYQEDAWMLVNDRDVTQAKKQGLLALVADGMGGMESGGLASATGIRVMTEEFQAMDREKPLEQQLVRSLRKAADTVCSMLRGFGGSTMIACILFEEQLCYAGVGDSFLYLLRNGTLVRINREQNVLHQRYLQWIRDGMVNAAAGEGVVQPHAIVGFLGAKPLKEVDYLNRALPLEDGDVLLLCSDGVGGVLSPEEIISCLSAPSANEAAEALNRAVLAKENVHQDNYTAIVICCRK